MTTETEEDRAALRWAAMDRVNRLRREYRAELLRCRAAEAAFQEALSEAVRLGAIKQADAMVALTATKGSG